MRARRVRRHGVLAAVLAMTAATLSVGAAEPAEATYSEPIMAWVHQEPGGRAELWVGAPDMTGAHRLYASPTLDVSHPAVSRDGTKVAFSVGRPRPDDAFWWTPATIFSIDVDGSDVTQWTAASADYWDSAPVWTPDGSALYFVREDKCRAGGSHSCVPSLYNNAYHVGSPGGAPLKVPNTGWASDLTLSPDGKYLAWTYPASSELALMVVKSTGADPFLIAHDGASIWHPHWSPDGTRLLTHYRADVAPYTRTLAVFETSGDGWQQLPLPLAQDQYAQSAAESTGVVDEAVTT